jgi:hypothetical protein
MPHGWKSMGLVLPQGQEVCINSGQEMLHSKNNTEQKNEQEDDEQVITHSKYLPSPTTPPMTQMMRGTDVPESLPKSLKCPKTRTRGKDQSKGHNSP